MYIVRAVLTVIASSIISYGALSFFSASSFREAGLVRYWDLGNHYPPSIRVEVNSIFKVMYIGSVLYIITPQK